MSAQPWPMRHRDETGHPFGLSTVLACAESQDDGYWLVQELDRAHCEQGLPLDVNEHVAELRRFAAETLQRQGLARSWTFVRAVLDDDYLHDDHAALMANVRSRFGERGLLVFTGFLAAMCTAQERHEGRVAS
jgi:hypothetical protein